MIESNVINCESEEYSKVFELFHDFVFHNFGSEEVSFTDVSSKFLIDISIPIREFIGEFKIFIEKAEFKKWFYGWYIPQKKDGKDIAPLPMIKAKEGLVTGKSVLDICSAIKDKIPSFKENKFPKLTTLVLGERLHFFGVFYPETRTEKDYFGEIDIYSEVRYVKVERKAEQLQNILELKGVKGGYATKGEFVVGGKFNGVLQLLDDPRRAIIFRKWSDFEEKKKYNSLQEFLNSAQELQLTPRFNIKYKEIVIIEDGYLYTGFRMNMESRIMKADNVRVSIEKYDEKSLREIIYIFENSLDFNYWDGNFADTFTIGSPQRERWETTDLFFLDEKFWKPFTPKDVQGGNDSEIKGKTEDTKLVNSVQDKKWSAMDFSSCSSEEAEFLARFFNFVRKCGFDYTPRDLVRFHTSVKCGFFTLLGGVPGTGKSSLALLYSKAIAGGDYEDRKTFLRIDVNPGWMEPEDLLGYYSVSAKEFRESSTGLVSFLKEAQGSKNIYTACFEEMNLAHVEHYFSDFIQQMSRINGDRYICVENKSDLKIELNENLRFIGTINFDETTHELTARFYDRCNYIELTPPKVEQLLNRGCDIYENVLKYGCEGEAIKSEEFNKWKTNGNVMKDHDSAKAIIKEVYPLLKALHIEPSPRTLGCLFGYIASRPTIEGETDSILLAVDEVFVQRLLPVYRRPNERKNGEQTKLKNFLSEKKLKLSEEFFKIIMEKETPYQNFE